MSRHERHAWYNLTVALLAAGIVGALVPIVGPTRATAGFAVMALLAVGPAFFRFAKRAGEVLVDERDRLLLARANGIAFRVFWILWIVGLMAIWYSLGGDGTVPANVLPMLAFGGWVVHVGSQAAAVLFQYRRGSA